ncbi:MAG: hypothetical protein Q9221_008997 [Calogaya cf. arnoldii]
MPVNLRKRREVAAPTVNVQDIMEMRELSRVLTVKIRLQRQGVPPSHVSYTAATASKTAHEEDIKDLT